MGEYYAERERKNLYAIKGNSGGRPIAHCGCGEDADAICEALNQAEEAKKGLRQRMMDLIDESAARAKADVLASRKSREDFLDRFDADALECGEIKIDDPTPDLTPEEISAIIDATVRLTEGELKKCGTMLASDIAPDIFHALASRLLMVKRGVEVYGRASDFWEIISSKEEGET